MKIPGAHRCRIEAELCESDKALDNQGERDGGRTTRRLQHAPLFVCIWKKFAHIAVAFLPIEEFQDLPEFCVDYSFEFHVDFHVNFDCGISC